jgi:hypothetical protein
VLLALGKPNEGLEAARAGMDLFRSLGVLEEGEALVRVAFAEALRAADDPEAVLAIVEARDALIARANKIADAAHRGTFLERVEENTRTLALAAAWTGQASD